MVKPHSLTPFHNHLTVICINEKITLEGKYINPNKAELFEVSFSWGMGHFDTPSYFKNNLSNINITLYNC